MVARAADPLEQGGERARRAELDDQVDRADVDAELERRGRDRAPHGAALELVLGAEPELARHRAVVGHDLVGAEALLEGAGGALDQAAGVDEDQGRPVLADQLGDAVVDPAHLLVGRDRPELVVGDLDREVEVAAVAAVDDMGQGPAGADQQPRDPLDRPLGRRQADPDRRSARGLADQAVEALEGEREVGAALVAGDRVDLVDDHGVDGAERGPAAARGQQDVERLGRGDQDVRRPLRHLLALGHRRVAGADRDPDVRDPDSLGGGVGGELGQRRLEVLVDVVRQRLERRDVEDLGRVGQGRAGARRGRAGPGGRGRRGRRRGSCRSRSARRSACPRRRGCAASPRSGARSARRSARGTSRRRAGGTGRGRRAGHRGRCGLGRGHDPPKVARTARTE